MTKNIHMCRFNIQDPNLKENNEDVKQLRDTDTVVQNYGHCNNSIILNAFPTNIDFYISLRRFSLPLNNILISLPVK
ncbi:hypothetical protein GLYMA_06G081950v4 [Glycine max]|nr:hypothetical protein GLYMA_06G081950v4 [Glycine max]KAH1124753.1 hypothetical protein GYH30_014442 [Glycine max]